MAIFSPSPTYPKPLPIPTQSSSPLPFSIHSLRLSLPPSPLSTGPTPRLSRCHAALSPQPPPQSDPPPGKDPQATLSRLQDHVQIFLAVLFWMSLFFWASVWDGKNNGKGRLNKGSRPKR
ncbi:proline-rich receptor protein kinase [Salix suchowensis]|nr:proline-rich receptor protein kinase [Salix suchowensis]